MSRKPVLSEEQKAIINANIDLFAAEIKKMPEFCDDKKVSKAVIAAHQKKQNKIVDINDKKELASALSRYIGNHGLHTRYHGKNNVTGFLEYLKQ